MAPLEGGGSKLQLPLLMGTYLLGEDIVLCQHQLRDEQPTFITAMTAPAISYLLGHFSSLMLRECKFI